MASPSPQDDNRSSFERVLDEAAANAPEIDNDLLAPEYRGDNVPPEKLLDLLSIKDLPIQGVAPSHKSRTTVTLLAVAVVVLAMAALGIGLGLGLTREANQGSASDSPSLTTSLARPTSATYTSSGIQPFRTSLTSQHEVMRDTSIAAIDRPNGDKTVFSQEASGNLRQAIYSGKHNVWAADTTWDFQLVEDARKLTPLAVTEDPWSVQTNDSNSWIVPYVSSKDDAIHCMGFPDYEFDYCAVAFNWSSAKHVVAADSRHLSVSSLPPTHDLLMIYEDPSGKVNIMHGSAVRDYEWHNMTEGLDAMIDAESPGSYVTTTCTIINDHFLYCFTKNPKESASGIYAIEFSVTPGNMTFNFVSSICTGTFGNINNSGSATFAARQLFWFNQSTMQTDWWGGLDRLAPTPAVLFPYQRFCTTFVANRTNSYLYHQISESTIAQENWDVDPFWLPSVNITIDTEKKNTTAS